MSSQRSSALKSIWDAYDQASATNAPPVALARARVEYETQRKFNKKLFADTPFDSLMQEFILPAAQRKREGAGQTPSVGAGGLPPWMMAPPAGGPMQGAPSEQFWMAPQGAPGPLPWEGAAAFGLPMPGATSPTTAPGMPMPGFGVERNPAGATSPLGARIINNIHSLDDSQSAHSLDPYGPGSDEEVAAEGPMAELARGLGLGDRTPPKTLNYLSLIQNRALSSEARMISSRAALSKAQTYELKRQQDDRWNAIDNIVKRDGLKLRAEANQISRDRLSLQSRKLSASEHRREEDRLYGKGMKLFTPIHSAAQRVSSALRDAESDLQAAQAVIGDPSNPRPVPNQYLDPAGHKLYWQKAGIATAAQARIDSIHRDPTYKWLFGHEDPDTGELRDGMYTKVQSLINDQLGGIRTSGEKRLQVESPYGAPGTAGGPQIPGQATGSLAPKRRTPSAGAGRAGTLPGLSGLGPQGGSFGGTSTAPPPTKPLTKHGAAMLLREAGNDVNKARALARQRGFKF